MFYSVHVISISEIFCNSLHKALNESLAVLNVTRPSKQLKLLTFRKMEETEYTSYLTLTGFTNKDIDKADFHKQVSQGYYMIIFWI